jgi:hypothetical protein
MLSLDGTGYLYLESGIAVNYPLTILWYSGIGTGLASSFTEIWHGRTDNSAFVSATPATFGDQIQGFDKSEGVTRSIAKPLTSGFAAVRLKAVVFTTSQTRAAYYGSDVEATETFGGARVNHFPGHDKFVIGGLWNGSAYVPSLKGNIGEVHLIAGSLTDADYNAVSSGSLRPEELAGWIDGFALKDYSAGGTYTSIGGGRVLTAVGGVSASGQPHPVARVSAGAFAGAITLDGVTLAGSFQGVAAGAFSGAIALDGVTLSGSFGAASGTLVSEPLRTNNGTLLASTSLAHVAIYNDTTGALVLRRTDLSTNASGVFTVTDPAIVAGFTYRIDWETSGGHRRMPRKLAA